MKILDVDNTDIDHAFDRLLTFTALNKERALDDKIEGLILYCESVGMAEDSVNYIYELCEQYFEGALEPPACAFIGMLLGLAVCESVLDRQ